MKNKGLVLLALVGFMLSSCLKDDPKENTIILMGTESYVDSIGEVIPDTLLKVLADATVMQLTPAVLPQGNMPPDVQGEFVLRPKELLWYNENLVSDGDSIRFRFGGNPSASGYYPNGQHNRVTPCDYEENGLLGHTDSAYLMGSGNDFTAYFVLTYEHITKIDGVDYNMTRGYVITGKMNGNGNAIDNVRVAYINLNMKVNSNNMAVSCVETGSIKAMEGNIFVYKGTVTRQKWFKNNR
jgi:hypothetical protein